MVEEENEEEQKPQKVRFAEVGEGDLDPEAGKLADEDDLIGIGQKSSLQEKAAAKKEGAGGNLDDDNQVTDDEDLTEPFHTQKYEVQKQIFKARLAQLSSRPTDMMEFLLEAVQKKENHFVQMTHVPSGQAPADFTKRERETIYVGFKQFVSPIRVALRTVVAILENPKYSKNKVPLQNYHTKLLEELEFNCKRVIENLMKFCISRRGNSTESETFFNKMVGDYWRILGEFQVQKNKLEWDRCQREGKKYYLKAFDAAENGHGFKKPIGKCNCTYLSLVLHYSNFQHSILGKTEDAIRKVQEVMRDTEGFREDLEEPEATEVQSLVDMMEENLADWITISQAKNAKQNKDALLNKTRPIVAKKNENDPKPE